MSTNKKLYNKYISKLEESLIADNFEWIDYVLEYIYWIWLSDEDLIEIGDILQEATLYSEFKEDEYKSEALNEIWKYIEKINI